MLKIFDYQDHNIYYSLYTKNILFKPLYLLSVFAILILLTLLHIFPAILAYSVSEGEILNITNQKRQENNKSPLSLNSKLSNAAKSKASDMIAKQYFAHIPPGESSAWTFVQKEGYSYMAIAENIAQGYDSSGAVVDAWMGSSGHRANMLGDYKEAGFGIAEGSLNGRNTVVVVGIYAASRDLPSQPMPINTPTPTQMMPTPTPSTGSVSPKPTPTMVAIATPTPTSSVKVPTSTPTPTPTRFATPTMTTTPTPTPTRTVITPTSTAVTPTPTIIIDRASLEEMERLKQELLRRREEIINQLQIQSNVLLHSILLIG